MIDIGTANIYIGVPSMPRDKFENYSTRLFDEWDEYVGRTLNVPDYSLALEVEEGSIKVSSKIAVVISALYFGIGNYGSFISGLQTIREQVSSASDFLGERAMNPFAASGVEPKLRKSGGSLSQLQRLFVKVQRGEITPNQATIEAEALFGDDATSVPEFMQKLEKSFEETPRFHQQLSLPLDPLDSSTLLPASGKGRIPRPDRPRPILPPALQYRVEVWRESKKEERKIRVVEL